MGTLLNSYAIRNFAIFSAGFFVITMLLTAFVIIPKINKSIQSQHIKDTQAELVLEAELFTRYVSSQKTILQDLTKFPSLTNAVMLADASSHAVSDLFENVVIGGEKGRLILQDIEGGVLFQTGNDLQGSYTEKDLWLEQVLDGSIAYHFQLLAQENDQFTFKMSVPVIYENYVEGVLSAEITVILSEIFVTQDFEKDVAFRLSQDQRVIYTKFEHIEIANENSIYLDSPALTFTYITDDGPILKEARSLRNTILLVLLIGLATSFFLFALLGYSNLVKNDKTLKIKRSIWLVYSLPMFVGVVGVGASVAALLIILNLQQSSLESKLIADSKATIQSLREKVNSNLQTLDSFRAFYDASKDVDRIGFKIFSHPLLKNNRNIQAVEWIPNVQHNERKRYEEKAKIDGFADFMFKEKDSNGQMVSSQSQADYFPVYYIEPLVGNENSVGFDHSSDNERFAALLKARDSGKKVATGKVILESKSQIGVLLFHAIYDTLLPTSGVEGRQSQLRGFVVLVLKTEDLVQSSIGYNLKSQTMFVEDITEVNSNNVIYGTKPDDSTFIRSETIDFAGRTWKVTTYSNLSHMPLWWVAWLIFFSGIVFTALVMMGLVNLTRRREVVELLVEKRTNELQLLSSTVANSNDVFIITEADYLNLEDGGPRITYVNEAFTRLTGFTRKETVGNTPRMLQGSNTDRKELDKIRSTLEKGEVYSGELINYSKDGKEYWIELNIFPLKDKNGNITHFTSVERDITDRKLAQQDREQTQKELEKLIEKIYESNEFNDAIMSSSDHLIIATDSNGLITFLNQASENGLGYSTKDVVGIHSQTLWHDESEIIQRAKVLSLELGKTVKPEFDVFILKPQQDGRETQDWTFIRKNGTSFIGSLTVTCMRNSYGEITGYLGVIEDISERIKAQRERELMVDKLMISNEELERFAYVCSHDLQEPLRMISSFSEKLQNHISDNLEDDEKGKKYFKFVIDGANRAQALIADILTYSSISSDTQKLDNIAASALVETVKVNLQNALQNHSGYLTYDELPTLHGNKTQLYQLFQNVINNGIKYCKLDSTPQVHVSVQDAQEYWLFAIKDNGIGMEQRHLKKIFDVFQRLHRKSQYAGTGVGLSICKKVVECHGGKIWVESKKGVGSTFYFTLPKLTLVEETDD